MAFLKHSPVLHQPDSESEFFKIQTFVRFLPYNLFDVSYDPNFFFERKDTILDNLPNVLNMVIRRIENFLRAFEKKFRLQKMAFLNHSPVLHQPDSESEFFKIQTFVTFPVI